MKFFRFTKNAENVVIFKSSPFFLKMLNFLISVFILASNVVGMRSGEYSLIAMLVGIFCLAISTYQNFWMFDINGNMVFNKKGVLIFSKSVKYSFSEISSLMIEKYKRAGRSSEYTEISIQFKDGQRFIIENDKTKRLKDEIEASQTLQELIAYSS